MKPTAVFNRLVAAVSHSAQAAGQAVAPRFTPPPPPPLKTQDLFDYASRGHQQAKKHADGLADANKKRVQTELVKGATNALGTAMGPYLAYASSNSLAMGLLYFWNISRRSAGGPGTVQSMVEYTTSKKDMWRAEGDQQAWDDVVATVTTGHLQATRQANKVRDAAMLRGGLDAAEPSLAVHDTVKRALRYIDADLQAHHVRASVEATAAQKLAGRRPLGPSIGLAAISVGACIGVGAILPFGSFVTATLSVVLLLSAGAAIAAYGYLILGAVMRQADMFSEDGAHATYSRQSQRAQTLAACVRQTQALLHAL